MNRVEKRSFIRNMKGMKGLQKKHSKGCFGKISCKASEQLDLRIIPKSKRKRPKNDVIIG